MLFFPKDNTEKLNDELISPLPDKLLLGEIRHSYVI